MTDLTPILAGNTDVAAALTYAEAHALVDSIDLGHNRVLVRQREGENWKMHDTYPTGTPRRSKGIVNVHDAPSFVAAVAQRGEAIVYADEEQLALVAVLNDDVDGEPGWRDYRVSLALRPTEQWTAWKDGQGLGAQQRFAERIEDGLPEIVDPAGATMLEIAQTFQATIGVNFRSGHRLSDGQTQFAYEEDVKASAGTKPGTITIPETFTLGVAPFLGTEAYEVTARLRHRLPRQGDLQIGYQLVRPEAVERDAFAAIVTQAHEAMEGTLFLNGPAPAPTVP